VENSNGGVYTQFVFSPGGGKIAVVQAGTLVKATIPLPGGESAMYNSSGLNFIRHKDWLGSSRLATTWAHAVYSKEAYAPFGETYNEAGTPDRSFTGQDQDTVTGAGGSGVYDYLFRKYDPAAGRWLSPDPAGWSVVDQTAPQSLDRYAYVENQPMNATDPNGLACVYIDQNGGVSVSNDGADMASGICAAYGGNYVPGTLSVQDISFIPGQNSFDYSGDGTVSFQYMSSNANVVFGGTTYQGDLNNPMWSQFPTVSLPINLAPSGPDPNPTAPNNGDNCSVFSGSGCELKRLWKNNWDCVANVGWPVLSADLNPFNLGLGSAAAAASGASEANLQAVGIYSVSRGLTVPLRSSAVRAGVGAAELFGRASIMLEGINVIYAATDAIIAEHKGCSF
jgi:RHS repeat-associated protein